MKKLNRIYMIAILSISITSCKNAESRYCSKDCKAPLAATTNQENDNISTNSLKNDSLEFDFNLEAPLVCKLTGVEQAKRKEILQKEIFAKVKKVEEIESGYVFYFKYEELFLMKMTDYVIAENNCCPFFTFETKLHSKNDVSLKITGSKQAKEMIKANLINNI